MDMSWKRLTQPLQATSPGPVSLPSRFSHHLLGLLQIACSGTRFPFQLNSLPLCPRPINARWLSLNRHSNQGLMRLISQNLGRFVFSNKPSFLDFSFTSCSLTTSWLARSTTLNLIDPFFFLSFFPFFLPFFSFSVFLFFFSFFFFLFFLFFFFFCFFFSFFFFFLFSFFFLFFSFFFALSLHSGA